MTLHPILFTPVALGSLELAHRVVMAPLTRLRSAQPGDVPNAMMARYYGQRASAGGLIVTEATDVSPQAHGYPGAPGIYSSAQIDGWRAVADAVHAKGGLLVQQLWHTGRISHPSMQPGGVVPVAPSAVRPSGGHFDSGFRPVEAFETPRALHTQEVTGIVEDFRAAAANARAARMDGVEVHGANGYLIDQFLQDRTNRRSDRYGGSIENRARLLLEIVDAISSVWGVDRIGVRLSPYGTFNDMGDSAPVDLFAYVIGELSRRDIAYLHLVEPRASEASSTGETNNAAPNTAALFRARFAGPVIGAGGFTPASAEEAIELGRAHAVAFGRAFIANPDLPERICGGVALAAYDRSTFYGGDERGYVDYPALQDSDIAA